MRTTAHHLRSIAYSVYFYTIFLLVSYTYFFYGHFSFGHFKKNPHKKDKWRMLALKLVDDIFFLTRIRIHAEGQEHIPEDPVVFAANHQSYLDGLIIFHVIRRPFTAVTGPFSMFPPIIREWFAHMGYMSVSRDVFEELKYKNTIRLGHAVDACVSTLQAKTSILIFPEGRREFKKHLLPFHVGVVRMATESGSPVVPIILEHVDELLPTNSHLLSPARIRVKISSPVSLTTVSRSPLEGAIYLERKAKKLLPKSYFTEKSIPHCVHGARGAFFDLDDTLTRSNVFQDLVARYLMTHMSARNIGKISLVALKRLTLPHGRFYVSAMRTLKGIRTDEFLKGFPTYLKKNRKKIFYSQMVMLIKHHQKKGNKVFIISEEPNEVLEPIATFLGIPCFGTELEKEDGMFTGEVIGHIMKDEYKREKIIELAQAHHLDLEKSYAYGDSYHDYAMLRSVGHAALVNPKKSFGAQCKKIGFRIIHER